MHQDCTKRDLSCSSKRTFDRMGDSRRWWDRFRVDVVVGCLVRRWWDRFWVDVVVGCLVRRFAYLIAGVVFMVATAPS